MDETVEEIIEDKKEDIPVLEVKVVNPPEIKKVEYEPDDDYEYDELGVTSEQVKEFEDGDSSSK